MEIVIAVIENSISYNLGHIDFMVEGNNITVFEKEHNIFSACSLIGLISKIDKVNCYMDYNKKTDKIQLRIF